MSKGREIRVTGGTELGGIVFEEPTTEGTGSGRIVAEYLTDGVQHKWTLPNRSCSLAGLEDGEVWRASQGGTGLKGVPLNQILVGSGTDQLKLVPAPVYNNTFVGWDSVNMDWFPISLAATGEINTARNSGTAVANSAGIYWNKVGTELQFRRLVGDNGIQIDAVDDGTTNTYYAKISVDLNRMLTTIPVSKGGTGLTAIGDRQLVMGSGGTFVAVNASTSGVQYLRSNAANTAYEFVSGDRLLQGVVEDHPGSISYPQSGNNYYIRYRVPYAVRIERICYLLVGGGCGVSLNNLYKNSSGVTGTDILANQTIVPGEGELAIAKNTVAAGGTLFFQFTNSDNVEGFVFNVWYSRL